MKWQLGDQVWTVAGDGQTLRPVRLGVIGRVVPGGGFIDHAGKPPRFVSDYALFVFKCEADVERWIAPPAVIRRAMAEEQRQDSFQARGELATRVVSWPRVWSRRLPGARA